MAAAPTVRHIQPNTRTLLKHRGLHKLSDRPGRELLSVTHEHVSQAPAQPQRGATSYRLTRRPEAGLADGWGRGMFSDVSLGDIALCVLALSVAYLVYRIGPGRQGRQDPRRDPTRCGQPPRMCSQRWSSSPDTVALTNDQLARVDGITSNVGTMTTNASALTGLFRRDRRPAAGQVAAYSYGVRAALGGMRGTGGAHSRKSGGDG